MDTNEPQDPQDRIDDYLRGRSPDPKGFERELAQDPQLNEEMEATRLALDAITLGEDHQIKERLRRLEAGMAATPEATNQEAATPPRGGAKIITLQPRKRSNWLSYAAAAALLLFVAGYFLLRPAGEAGPQLAAATFTPFDNLGYAATRGSEQDPRITAYSAYEAGDFTAAESAFSAIGTDDPIDAFYLGQSLLGQQKYAEALPLFRRLSGLTDFGLAQESSYYTALALVGLDRQSEATPILEEITSDANHPLHTEATQLLDRL